MNIRLRKGPFSLSAPVGHSRFLRLLGLGTLLVILIALLSPRPGNERSGRSSPLEQSGRVASGHADTLFVYRPNVRSSAVSPSTADEIVTSKLAQFAQSRRNLAHAIAEHFKLSVPDELERFFDAAEAGRYDEMSAIYARLRLQREHGTDGPWYGPTWRTIVETQGAADAVHDWPAQKLLEYGNAVLDALRPGMIYAGGTDPGCFIPTMLNETSDGEHHIVLTQNALADGTYLDYLQFQYGDKMTTLTKDDSQRAFQEYIADAQKRFQHDQQFPDEPKQLRPGEDVSVSEGRVQVSGQVAVMAINERLFQTLMQNNPEVSFAMEESFTFKSMFPNATTLGPILELNVQDPQNALTPERATQSVEMWRATAQQLLSDPETAEGSDPRKAYAKMASSQAGLFLARDLTGEADQAFTIATEIYPASPDAVYGYVNMLVKQNRFQEAMHVGQNALNAAPENTGFGDLVVQLKKLGSK